MTVPGRSVGPAPTSGPSPLIRSTIWVAIGALIAAALVCVAWVFVGSQDGIVGRAFLTILLLVAFAGVSILEAHLAPRRPAWFALASVVGWVALLLIGAVMIWMPEGRDALRVGLARFILYLVIVLIVQLVLLHVRLFMKASQRHETTFTQVVSIVTVVLVIALAVLLIVPLIIWEYVSFPDLYWRFVTAAAILAAVGTTLVPLMNVLSAPKTAPVADAPAGLAPWPTYAETAIPLPVMADGSPDWGAFYTGRPSPGAHVVGEPAPAQPGYAGFPPPPPLPPRP
ncbi:hypothetical protein QL996_06200 [Planococcus sp. APC 4015]|nr:hypothetical protein [Planococcus sp. APC 4015]